MEQEGAQSKRQRTVAGLPVRSRLILVGEIPVNYDATREIDDRPVYDHKTSERLSPHLVKVGRQTEHDAMTRRQLFECVPIAMAPQKQSSTESWMARHEESSQSTCTRRRDEPSTSTSKRTRRLRSGCVPERALGRPDTFKFVGYASKTPFVTRSCVFER